MKKNILIAILTIIPLLGFYSCKSNSEEIVTLTTNNFKDVTANGVVLVDFWATWCMPCKAMAPIIDEIANQTNGKIKVGKVDIDKESTLANQFGIQAIPTLLIFKDGELVETLTGLRSKEAIIASLEKYVALQ